MSERGTEREREREGRRERGTETAGGRLEEDVKRGLGLRKVLIKGGVGGRC